MDFGELVARHARLWEIDTASEQAAAGACRDAKDDKSLALALACDAATLVSSDDDLLVLHPWQGIQMLRPAAFLRREN
jgi:predicted nucleic acid-binding protein